MPISFEFERSEVNLSVAAEAGDSVAVFSEKERILMDVWAAVLSICRSSFSLDSNFFSSGGDSLRSIQVVAAAKKASLRITVPQIFNNTTVRSLSLFLSKFL